MKSESWVYTQSPEWVWVTSLWSFSPHFHLSRKVINSEIKVKFIWIINALCVNGVLIHVASPAKSETSEYLSFNGQRSWLHLLFAGPPKPKHVTDGNLHVLLHLRLLLKEAPFVCNHGATPQTTQVNMIFVFLHIYLWIFSSSCPSKPVWKMGSSVVLDPTDLYGMFKNRSWKDTTAQKKINKYFLLILR